MKYIVKHHSDRILFARVHNLNTKQNFERQKYNTMIYSTFEDK
jgi:hypothetical protein